MFSVLVALVGSLSIGCLAPGSEPEEPVLGQIEDARADNYFSPVAKEYSVRIRTEVSLPEPTLATEEPGSEPRVETLQPDIHTTTRVNYVVRALTAHLEATLDDDLQVKELGFRSMVRNMRAAVQTIERLEATRGMVTFVVDVAGPPDLIARLGGPGSVFRFKAPGIDGTVLDQEAAITPNPTPTNAYPEYGAFVEDGVYDLTVLFGHDYTEDRWDITRAKALFEKLVSAGFAAPVKRFDELTPTSGPFVSSAITHADTRTRIEVRIFHSNMWNDDRAGQKELMLAELATRDVFFYHGHGGPEYGISIDPDDTLMIRAEDIAQAPLTAKKQLVIAWGCQTYSQYADMFYANPVKNYLNLDAITTVNYSYDTGSGAKVVMSLLAIANGYHNAPDYGTLLSRMNAGENSSSSATYFGVIGLDDNPRLHPYATRANIGASCSGHQDCGNPEAMTCAGSFAGRCVATVTAIDSCPAMSSPARVRRLFESRLSCVANN